MARQDAVPVRIFPDTARRVRKLYALEEEARRARRDLWAFDHLRVRASDDLGEPAIRITHWGRLERPKA